MRAALALNGLIQEIDLTVIDSDRTCFVFVLNAINEI